MKHVWIYALSIAAKLRLVADCHVLQSIAVDKSEYPPGGYLVPKELFEQALDVIIPELKGEGDKFDRLNKIWDGLQKAGFAGQSAAVSRAERCELRSASGLSTGVTAPGLGQRGWCLSRGRRAQWEGVRCRDWGPVQVPSTRGFNISGGERLRWSVGALGWGNLCKLNWFLQLWVDENWNLWGKTASYPQNILDSILAASSGFSVLIVVFIHF